MHYVYHGSSIAGLSRITPNISTHKSKYVYASEYKLISIIFLARWNDFLLTLKVHKIDDGIKIQLIERYRGAFKDIYESRDGYIYKLNRSNFSRNTDWEFELTSLQPVDVLTTKYYDNIYEELLRHNRKGDIELFFYPNRPESIPIDDSDMYDKAIELYKLSGNAMNFKLCIERFPKFKEELEEYVRLNNICL